MKQDTEKVAMDVMGAWVLPDDDSRPSVRAIRRNRTAPLILIRHRENSVHVGVSPKEKDELFYKFSEPDGDILLWPWPGQWETRMFRLSMTDLKGWLIDG